MAQIESKNISVIVQGPIHKTFTKKVLQNIRKNLPDSEIILSTWENSSTFGLDYNILVINKDPGAECIKYTNNVQYNNINRMILSTNEGLKKATRKYTLKIRTDICIDNLKFLDMFELFPNRIPKYQLFEHRIIASTLFSKIGVNNRHDSRVDIAFHISDWWFFGLTTDIKKLLLPSTCVQEPYFSNYFMQPQNKRPEHEIFNWKFPPEQWIGYSCFSKYFEDIRMKDCSVMTSEINKKSQICLANNFIFLEYKQSGIRNLKYLSSLFEPFTGEQYFDLYNFDNFENEYKKYCDKNYIKQSSNFILKNRDLGYSILRFYKHIYKLINPNTKIVRKLEQLVLGIPISLIVLILSLFKYLKEQHK